MCNKVAMQLKDYLALPGQTASDLAAKCGVSVSTITRASLREYDPSLRLLRKIERHTGGKVKPNDFLPEPPVLDRLEQERL